jgi:PAS domain S-box-containing protein
MTPEPGSPVPRAVQLDGAAQPGDAAPGGAPAGPGGGQAAAGGAVEPRGLRDPVAFAAEIRAALRFEAGLAVKAAAVLAVLAVLLALRAMYLSLFAAAAGERLAKGEQMARRKVPLRMRAISAAVAALTITVLASVVALIAAQQSQHYVSELGQRLVPVAAAADDLTTRIADQRALLRSAVTEGHASGLTAVDAAAAAARGFAAQVAAYASGDPALTARLGALTAAQQAWVAQVADPQEAALRRGDAAAAQALQADTAHVFPYVNAVLKTGYGLESQITAEQRSVIDSLGRAHDVLLGALIAMIVVAAASTAEVIIGVWRGMFRPLQRLAQSVRGVSEGTCQQAIPIVGPPEIAGLSRDVELMRARLVAAIAERERADQSLRSLFEMAPDAMLGVTRGGSIVMANAAAARMYGYAGRELVGRDVTILVPEDQRAKQRMAAERYFLDERSRAQWHTSAVCGLRSDGTQFPAEVRLSSMPTDAGMLIIIAVRDVTERMAMDAERERLRIAAEREQFQRRLQQSERLGSLGQLVGGVAHDFNNLLGIISGYAEFAVDQLETFAGQDERLQPVLEDMGQVQAAAQQAIRVTRQLLTFARSKPASREALDFNEVVRTSGPLLGQSLGGRIELVIATGDGLWPVEADRGQLEQVLVNLTVNARDAMPGGGRLSITTGNAEVDAGYAGQRPGLKPGRYCRLSVADTGTGMDAATIERVFEPFFSTKPRGRGTGLGLATVYGIVSGMGGIIEISSAVGVGTTMNVLLPVAAKAVAAVPGPSPSWEDPRGNGETILLVEDEESMRAMAARILSRNGYLVREAADGAAALRLAGDPAERVDLLVTDLVMPGMLGNEVIDRVRAARPGLPALLITGSAQQVPDVRAPDLDIVQKPFTEAVLLARVRRALDRSGAARIAPP